MPDGRTLWIIDGHNVIFAVPRLCALQMEGDRAGARRELEIALQRVESRGEGPVIVVYDGNALPRNPDAKESATISICFSQPPEEADDRIVFLATQALSRRQDVAVVTNDRRSLASRLPARARVWDVDGFWRKHVEPADPTLEREKNGERPEGDFSDIERHFLSRSRDIEANAARVGRRIERQRSRQWKAKHAACSDGSEEESVPLERGRPVMRPSAVPPARPEKRPSEKTPPPAPIRAMPAGSAANGSAQSDLNALARARRKARGQRQQKRRLERLRRGRTGRSKGKA